MERLRNTKWLTTVCSIWIQCSCGAPYTFGIYSSILKSSQSYSQSTLDTISVFKDIGANVGVLSGLLYTSTLFRRFRGGGGPLVVLLAGALQSFVGYFLIWASVVGLIHKPPVVVMCLFMLVAAHAQTFFNTANVVTGVRNFGNYSGTIVGIMKGFIGLSGAILVQFYDTVCQGDPATYILLLAITPSTVSLLLMRFVKNYDVSMRDDKKHLNAFSAIALVIAAYLMAVIILENIFTLLLWERIIIFVVLLLLISSPIGVAIRAHREGYDTLAQALLEEWGSKPRREAEAEDEADSDDRRLSDGEDLNLLQALRKLNFWLLFICMFCGLGSGLATVNNISQIGESLGYTTIEINSLVSLWSIWNFLGRFVGGFVSDAFLHRSGWPRPVFMVITLATMAVGHIIIACGFSQNLYLGSVLVGISYGSQWSLMPTISSEIFGVKHLGSIFNTIAIASPLGSYIFSVRVIGYIYDKAAKGEGDTCYGSQCFMLSFFIMSSIAFIGCFVSFLLYYRTKMFYRELFRRLRHF